MRTRTFRRTALILSALFALAVLLAVGIQFAHAGHHCQDGHCPLCVAYTASQLAFKALGAVALVGALSLFTHASSPAFRGERAACAARASLVTLGIRMNN